MATTVGFTKLLARLPTSMGAGFAFRVTTRLEHTQIEMRSAPPSNAIRRRLRN